jgi:hypothetical protein
LEGRLFVAHNARFDYAFLRAEFERAGIAFHPDVICSVMLSRHLSPGLDRHHDMDSLWHVTDFMSRSVIAHFPTRSCLATLAGIASSAPKARIADAVGVLLCGPVLPPSSMRR